MAQESLQNYILILDGPEDHYTVQVLTQPTFPPPISRNNEANTAHIVT